MAARNNRSRHSTTRKTVGLNLTSFLLHIASVIATVIIDVVVIYQYLNYTVFQKSKLFDV